jgi:MFS family permease
VERFRRNAALFWTGQFVSQTGDAVFTSAVVWLAASLMRRESATAFVVFLGAVPFLLLGPLAGAWVDRGDRRRIMVASDLVRAGLLVAMPIVATGWGLSYGLVAGTTLLVAAASTPFLPARDALVPRLAEGRPLATYNAAFQTSGPLAQVAGLWLGGVFLGTSRDDPTGVLWVVAADGVTFLVSAVTLAMLVLPPLAAGTPPPRARRLWADAADGLRAAAKDPFLRALLVLTALDNLAIMGPAIVGAAHYVRDDLGLGPRHLAWFEGAMALGFLVGALLLVRVGTRWPAGRVLLVGMTLDGLTYVPLAFVRDYGVALATVVVHGAFIPFIVVARTSLLQRHVPAERAGRVFALVDVTVAGMTALSALAAGAVGDAFGAPSLFLAAGVFGAACGLFGAALLPRVRSAR